MNFREQVLALYPNAICTEKYKNFWIIMDGDKVVSHSFSSELQAWEWALIRTNQKILKKFAE